MRPSDDYTVTAAAGEATAIEIIGLEIGDDARVMGLKVVDLLS